MGLGKAQAALGNTTEALTAYQQALAILRRLSQNQWVLETLGELARLHMHQGDGVEALGFVSEILTALESAPFHGSREPLLVMLLCYEVLQASADVRAHQLLNKAYQQLQRQAATIGDDRMRQSFLHNVRVNHKIIDL